MRIDRGDATAYAPCREECRRLQQGDGNERLTEMTGVEDRSEHERRKCVARIQPITAANPSARHSALATASSRSKYQKAWVVSALKTRNSTHWISRSTRVSFIRSASCAIRCSRRCKATRDLAQSFNEPGGVTTRSAGGSLLRRHLMSPPYAHREPYPFSQKPIPGLPEEYVSSVVVMRGTPFM
jgi:hypothetical protein